MSTEIINNCGCCGPACCPKVIHSKSFNCYYGTYETVNLLENGFPNQISCNLLNEELPDGYKYEWELTINESTGQRTTNGLIDADGNLLAFPETIRVFCRYVAYVYLACVVKKGLLKYYYNIWDCNPNLNILTHPNLNPLTPINYITARAVLKYINGATAPTNLAVGFIFFEIYNYDVPVGNVNLTMSQIQSLVSNGQGRIIRTTSASFFYNGVLNYPTFNYNYINSVGAYPYTRYFYGLVDALAVLDFDLCNVCEFFIKQGPPTQLHFDVSEYSTAEYPYYVVLFDSDGNFISFAQATVIAYSWPAYYQVGSNVGTPKIKMWDGTGQYVNYEVPVDIYIDYRYYTNSNEYQGTTLIGSMIANGQNTIPLEFFSSFKFYPGGISSQFNFSIRVVPKPNTAYSNALGHSIYVIQLGVSV